jgi:hypothetical protein
VKAPPGLTFDLTPAPHLGKFVPGDPEQPRFAGAEIRAESVKRSERHGEDLGREVGGKVRAASRAAKEAEEQVLVAVVEDAEGLRVGPPGFKQFLI